MSALIECNILSALFQLPSSFAVNFPSFNALSKRSMFLPKHLQNPFETGNSGNSGVLNCSACCGSVALSFGW